MIGCVANENFRIYIATVPRRRQEVGDREQLADSQRSATPSMGPLSTEHSVLQLFQPLTFFPKKNSSKLQA